MRKAQVLGMPFVRIPFRVQDYVSVTFQPLIWTLLERVPVPWSSYPEFVRLSPKLAFTSKKVG